MKMPHDRDIHLKLLTGYLHPPRPALESSWVRSFSPGLAANGENASLYGHRQRPSVPSAYVAHSVYAPRSVFPHVVTPSVQDPIKLGEWERDDKELFNGKDRPGRSYLHRDMELRPLTHFPQGSCNLITPFRLVEAQRWWCDPLLARIWSEKPGESTRGEG
ncbi:hypothetical protein I7I48_02703 [Histoplasma ohiense]|nr:hypothetical protein I7I48_02703 [Histoplasma ohiense (nom. inval.)]